MASKHIAVAGGTGGIGRHVVEGLLEIKTKYSLEIIVLSRSAQEPIHFASSSAPVVAVDYDYPDSIETVLREHSIDTIISSLSGTPETFVASLTTSQENLLAAALRVPTFRRFAPSEFAIDSEQLGPTVQAYRVKFPILQSLRKAKLERGASFEFTKFNGGIFMNYFGFGNSKPDGEKALGHLKPFPFILDLAKRRADIPGDGEIQLRTTRAEDIGKFVAAATQLDSWPEKSEMAGDIVTMNEVVRIAERVCPGVKIDVNYHSKEEFLAQMDPNPATVFTNFALEMSIAYLERVTDFVGVPSLNELTDVKPVKVEEYIRTWWGN